MSPWGGSGRRRTGGSATPPDRAAGDGAGPGKLGVLLSLSYPLLYPLLAVLSLLSLLRSLLCRLWSRTTAAVTAEPRAPAERGDGSGSPEGGQRVRRHHGRAFEFISAALRIDEDEQGDKQQAVGWYQRGIRELEEGISIRISAGGEKCERDRRLQKKMGIILTMATDRLQSLVPVLSVAGASDSTDPTCQTAHLRSGGQLQ